NCRLPSCGDAIVDSAETCDRGGARCVGGRNSGAPCCTEAECGDGECSGGDCSANRDDLPGCCRCDCTVAACSPLACDDGVACTSDTCQPLAGCGHAGVSYETVGDTVVGGFTLPPCAGEQVPPAIGRLLNKARAQVLLASSAPTPKRAAHLVTRAMQRLR